MPFALSVFGLTVCILLSVCLFSERGLGLSPFGCGLACLLALRCGFGIVLFHLCYLLQCVSVSVCLSVYLLASFLLRVS